MKNQLSNNLIALMEARQVGGAQLARAINIPLSTIKNIRKGTNVNPTIETLIPLANYFDVSIEDIISTDLARQAKKKLNHCSKQLPQPVPVITWEEAIAWPNIILSDKQIFTEKPCREAFALNSELNPSEVFSTPGVILVDPMQQPNHLDYVLVHKVGLDRASVRQFIRDEDRCYLKSLIIKNNIVEYDQGYRLLGIIIEYRQLFKSKYDEKTSNDFISCKNINELVLMEE
jgi:transcriptional regulator with XRE-family HTH domain